MTWRPLTTYAQAHCELGAQASRDFDPVIAVEHLEVAVALLAKATAQLHTISGPAPDEQEADVRAAQELAERYGF